MKAKSHAGSAAQVAALYLLVAAAWILGSDHLVNVVAQGDARWVQTAQTLKGLFFVLLMTAMIFLVVWRLLKTEARYKRMESMLAVSEKLEVVGSFAATTAHDLNNMLMVVRGMTELAKLEQQSGEPLSGERLEEIEGAVVRASDLVRQLSLFVRGGGEEATEASASALLRSFEPLLKQAASKEVDFRFEVPGDLGCVRVHAATLEQALLNLVVNARDAVVGRGRARIVIEADRVELKGHMSLYSGRPRWGTYLRIVVSDNGPGIPPDQTVRVFEPFFTTKAAGQGTGLGLSSVMRTMQRHEGWVALDSAVGVGCHFALYLPAVKERAAARAA